jgi:hypothetical protein
MTEQTKVLITGVKETRAALRQYEPEMLKQLDAKIRQEIKPVIETAKGLVPEQPPMSGWRTVAATNGKTRGGAGFPAWDASEIRKGIKQKAGKSRKRGRAKSSLLTVRNESASGSIYEVAGRKSSGKGTGAQMISNLNNRGGTASRLIYKALDTVGKDKIAQAVKDAYDQVKKELQAALDKAG